MHNAGFDVPPTSVRSDITLRMSLFPELADMVDHLATDLGKTPFETIALGLVMLKIVVEAGQNGKRLAITDDDLNIEREILIPGHADDNA